MHTNSTHAGSSLGVKNGLLYLLVGGGIGATIALLFAPKSGTELREDISGFAHQGYDRAKDLAENVKVRSGDLLETAKAKRDQVFDFATQTWSRAESTVAEAQDKINGEILEIQDKAGSQKAIGSGRRSSNIV